MRNAASQEGLDWLFRLNGARKTIRESEPSYVPTISDRLLSQSDARGVADAVAIDDAQDAGSYLIGEIRTGGTPGHRTAASQESWYMRHGPDDD